MMALLLFCLFLMIAGGFGIWKILEGFLIWLLGGVILMSIIFLGWYLEDYLKNYGN
jgi:hypothetical protein